MHRGQRLIVVPEHVDYMNNTSPSATNYFHLVSFLGWFLMYHSPIIITRGKGGQRPPSPLVWVVGATLISSEEVVFK